VNQELQNQTGDNLDRISRRKTIKIKEQKKRKGKSTKGSAKASMDILTEPKIVA